MQKNTGWITLHRSILEWEWYNDINVRLLFLHLILVVNHKDNKWRGILVKRGQKLTSYSNLAKETGLSVKQVRVALNKLKRTGEVASESTSQYTIVTIKNYDTYQDKGKPMASEGQARGKRGATNNNGNNGNNVDNNKNSSKDEDKKSYGNKDINALREVLKKNYPKALRGITESRKLYNLKQVLSKRKNQDEWMDEDWKKNFLAFLKLYLGNTEEKYLVESVDNLKERAKLWREYRGKLN